MTPIRKADIMEEITTAFTTGAGTIVSNLTDLVAGIVPVALPILGVVIAVGMGIKIIKKVAGR